MTIMLFLLNWGLYLVIVFSSMAFATRNLWTKFKFNCKNSLSLVFKNTIILPHLQISFLYLNFIFFFLFKWCSVLFGHLKIIFRSMQHTNKLIK